MTLLSRRASERTRDIAASYLPNRYHYWYSRSKLATDPLYRAAAETLRSPVPLLDVGCGIGLLLQYLRAVGNELAYLGIDNDADKIRIAHEAAERSGLRDARFQRYDLTRDFPQHRGSVALLDVLQYFAADCRDEILRKAAACITPQGMLIMRVGLDDHGWRARLTRVADHFGHRVRWMVTPPKSQPTRAGLIELLSQHGLECEFHPLWGRTPFNNWLVLARHPCTANASESMLAGDCQIATSHNDCAGAPR